MAIVTLSDIAKEALSGLASGHSALSRLDRQRIGTVLFELGKSGEFESDAVSFRPVEGMVFSCRRFTISGADRHIESTTVYTTVFEGEICVCMPERARILDQEIGMKLSGLMKSRAASVSQLHVAKGGMTMVQRDHTSAFEIFSDLGFLDADAAEMAVKAEATSLVRAGMQERGYTQAQLAGLCGMRQPHISSFLRGDLDDFSIERINRILAVFGLKVVTAKRFSICNDNATGPDSDRAVR